MTDARAKAALLTVTELPTGWVAVANKPDSQTKSTVEPAVCQAMSDNLNAKNASVVKEKATFEKGSGLGVVQLEVSVASFPDGDQASRVKQVADTLTACSKMTITAGAQKSDLTFAAMSFPNLGDRTAATRATIALQGITATADFIIVADGHNLINIDTAGIASIQADELEQIARRRGEGQKRPMMQPSRQGPPLH